MSDLDAYDDDMRWIFASSDREIDRLLAGKTPADDERLDDLSAFLAELKDAYLEPLDEGTEIRHLAAIGAALRSAPDDTPVVERVRPNRRSTRMGNRYGRAAAKFAATAVVVFAALTGGLAVAGVDIPILPEQAADQAKEAVAEHAADAPEAPGRPDEAPPDSARTPEFLETLRAALADTPPEERGCEFGQAIATIASGSDPTEGDPCAKGESRSDNRGNGQPGGGNAGEPQGSKATGEQASGGVAASPGQAGGKATGEQASGGVAANPPQAGSKATGDQASNGISAGARPASPGSGAGAAGQQTGQDAAAGGKQIGQDAAGGGAQQAPVPVTTPAPAGNRP